MIIFSLVDIMLDGSCKSSGRVHGEGRNAHFLVSTIQNN